ncbi:alpha/beta hydrolase [Actinomyces naeslundii]|uniref:alpha/beta hydrolase n=1 Tax=Actinomyces naeslundii TaxID=1655 RepID=UPI00096D4448|nr:alpha/beta hydrolase [Actinomyces naeslundii]OMG15723.1 proteinase [Actinomyces naeslundii]OMG22191.1 proteinase [Actinomyces naeslundii]OMG32821.1 proteinase [Actinomyces naeslundii]
MRRLRTTSPSHATSALAVLTLLGTITACSMFGANTAVAASPPAQSPHHAGVVLDSGTSSNSNAGISQTTGSNSSHGSGGSTGSTGASVPKGLESFYHQDLTWTDCTDDATGTAFQCATVTVPLDYDNPQGQTITVALKKLPSTSSSPRGSVFLNPGGPGGSGISVIESQAELYKSGDLSEVLANYDVIGFDPRGVGQSTPITCWTPEDVQAILAGQAEVPFSPLTPGSAADIVTQGSREAAACEEHTEVPEILDHADTRSVARDMDVMRALVGDKDLNYLGYSYGTYLGAVYTELFPDNIGRVVLDSAMDPTMARQDPMEGDAAAGEQSLRTYIESQQGQAGFPLSGTTDAAVAQLATFLDGLDADPLTVSGSGTPLNRAKAVDAISKLVTTSPDKWPLLTEGLTQAMNAHDGSALKANADAVSGNSAPPTTEKQVVEQLQGLKVFSANRCLDFPDAGNESSWDAALASYHHDYPVFHSLLPQYDAFCHGWGHTSRTEAVDVDVEATNPMLVIGILHDPQTPYPWSKALVSKIRNSHLLSVDMYGHGATGSNACTSAKVSDYLVNGTLPSDGEICPADPEPQAGGGEKG